MSYQTESKLISAILNDKEIYYVLQSTPELLFKTHKDVWDFVRKYSEQNSDTPPISVVEQKFEDFTFTKDVGSTQHHLNELKAEYLRSSLEQILMSTASDLKKIQPEKVLQNMVTQTSELERTATTVRDIDVTDTESAKNHFEKIKLEKSEGRLGVKTNLKGFDELLPSGISNGHFGILMAYPSIGKSWLAAYMAVEAWKANKKPLFISLEMTESEVRNRVYTIMANGRFSHKKLSGGEIDIEEFTKWSDIYLKDGPIFPIVSTGGTGEITPSAIRGKIGQYKPDIVFIDYIQLMQPNGKTENEVVRIKNISRELKILAVSENVPVIAIASATPDDVTDMSNPPNLGQVAWSKQLAYDSDFVLSLGRSPGSTILNCVFRKNRHGHMGEFFIDVDFDSGLFMYKDVKI
jgi:replicative DNA helicase